MTAEQIQTEVGTATVLHRLALAVECRDILFDRGVVSALRVGREAVPRLLPRPLDRSWPCLDLESQQPGRFKLRRLPTVSDDPLLRVDDPSRRYVPRRFAAHLWPLAALDETAGPYVSVLSRLLRSWLWPGSAYPAPRGATVVRGRILRAGRPARWARVVAVTPNNVVAGRGHADDRGEFLLVVGDTGQKPVESNVGLDLIVRAIKVPLPVDPVDRCADLVVEDVPRSASPPTPANLDNTVLRGIAVPPGYVANTNPPTHVTAPVGAELVLADAIAFDPVP